MQIVEAERRAERRRRVDLAADRHGKHAVAPELLERRDFARCVT